MKADTVKGFSQTMEDKMSYEQPSSLSTQMANVLTEIPQKDFEPIAFFDKHLDSIRVHIKDCSFTEIRLDRTFTIYEANHSDTLEYVGFSIKGIRYYVKELGLPIDTPMHIAALIDYIVKANPEMCVDLIQKQFSSILSAVTIEDLEQARLAA